MRWELKRRNFLERSWNESVRVARRSTARQRKCRLQSPVQSVSSGSGRRVQNLPVAARPRAELQPSLAHPSDRDPLFSRVDQVPILRKSPSSPGDRIAVLKNQVWIFPSDQPAVAFPRASRSTRVRPSSLVRASCFASTRGQTTSLPFQLPVRQSSVFGGFPRRALAKCDTCRGFSISDARKPQFVCRNVSSFPVIERSFRLTLSLPILLPLATIRRRRHAGSCPFWTGGA